ncbi:MAG: hypothetical protein ABIB71_02280 [Candidatus Woesearchaeota archaeon]
MNKGLVLIALTGALGVAGCKYIDDSGWHGEKSYCTAFYDKRMEQEFKQRQQEYMMNHPEAAKALDETVKYDPNPSSMTPEAMIASGIMKPGTSMITPMKPAEKETVATGQSEEDLYSSVTERLNIYDVQQGFFAFGKFGAAGIAIHHQFLYVTAYEPGKTLELIYPHSRNIKIGVADITYDKIFAKEISTRMLLEMYVDAESVDELAGECNSGSLSCLDVDKFTIPVDGIIKKIEYK